MAYKTKNLWILCTALLLVCLFTSLLSYLPEPLGSRYTLFQEGAKTTLWQTFWASILGLPLGAVIGTLRSRHAISNGSQKHEPSFIFLFLRKISGIYLWLIQGTPLLVQILIFYFGLPVAMKTFGFPGVISEWTSCVAALTLNVAAYHTLVFESGFNHIQDNLLEMATSLNFSHSQKFKWVLLPLCLRHSTPPLLSNTLALLKDSALASSIGVLELTLSGNRVSTESFHPIPCLMLVAAFYLLMTTWILLTTRYIHQVKFQS